MVDMNKKIYGLKYPFESRYFGPVKNSSGWNSSDVGDALVLLTAIFGAILVIAIL